VRVAFVLDSILAFLGSDLVVELQIYRRWPLFSTLSRL
jgi:hypothetical protein